MTRLLLTFAIVFVLASPAAAQILGARLNIYNSGAGPTATPITFFDFLNAATVCNQVPPAAVPSPVVNPTRAIWDDPANAGRVCIWTDPGTGPLFSQPVGASYLAGLQFFDAAGRGPESNRVPFGRQALTTVVPTGLRLHKQE